MKFKYGICENELTLEALIGFFMLCLLWLTYLTHKLRQLTFLNHLAEKEKARLLLQIKNLNKILSQYVQKEEKASKAEG